MKKTKEEIAKDWDVFFTPEGEEVSDVLEAMEEYKDQELEDLQAKCDKLREAFDKMNVHFASTRWASKESQEKQINSWNKSAGLTE